MIGGSTVELEGGGTEPLVIWNVSDRGLCIWVKKHYKNGTIITLSLGIPVEQKVECEVRWIKPLPDERGYLLGLEATSGDVLREVHRLVAGRAAS
jgi:hypothetical protein